MLGTVYTFKCEPFYQSRFRLPPGAVFSFSACRKLRRAYFASGAAGGGVVQNLDNYRPGTQLVRISDGLRARPLARSQGERPPRINGSPSEIEPSSSGNKTRSKFRLRPLPLSTMRCAGEDATICRKLLQLSQIATTPPSAGAQIQATGGLQSFLSHRLTTGGSCDNLSQLRNPQLSTMWTTMTKTFNVAELFGNP